MSFLDSVTNQWLNNFINGTMTNSLKSTEPVTVPFGQASSSAPLGMDTTKPLPLSQSSTNYGMGFSVEISSKSTEQKTIVPISDTTETKSNATDKPVVKTGESVDERLLRYYPKYKDAKTKKEKEIFLERYLTGSYAAMKGKSKEEQTRIQLIDFKKLLFNTKDPDLYQMLAEKINVLEKENQVSGAKSATMDQSSAELRERGYLGVAETTHNCDADNQVKLTKLVTDSGNEQAIKIGASHISECDSTNQIDIVKIYQTAPIQDNAQKEVDKILIDQYGKYAEENKVAIHKIMSASKFSETVEYAASNIWQFKDKEIQSQAIQITMDTKNEKAINSINITPPLSDNDSKSETENNTIQTNIQSTTTETDSNSKITAFEELIKNKDSISLEKSINELSDIDKMKLLAKHTNDESIIKAILNSNPSLTVLKEIGKLIKDEDILKKIGYKTVLTQLCFLDQTAQSVIIEAGANDGNLNKINRNYLKSSIKPEYDKLLKKGDEGSNIG